MHHDLDIGRDQLVGERRDLSLVRVNAARRHQAHEVRPPAGSPEPLDESLKCRQPAELALLDRGIDAREVLHDDASGAQVHMADL